MKKYLSFGGGVNSVAMLLMLLMLLEEKNGYDEAIFVDHGTDWPETYEYFNMLQDWLKANGHQPITVLKPDIGTIEGKRFDNLYDYYLFKKLTLSRKHRSCTDKGKVTPVLKYVSKPCFMLIGIDSGEAHRAKISINKGVENRWPLIEHGVTRAECKEIIKKRGLPVPMKSGCFCCPFQRKSQFKLLRRKHPELFCKVERMEKAGEERRGLADAIYLKDMPIREYIDESQRFIFEQDEYPPCQCGL